MPEYFKRLNSISAANGPQQDGKLAYITAKSRLAGTRLVAIPGQHRVGCELFGQHVRIAFGDGYDCPRHLPGSVSEPLAASPCRIDLAPGHWLRDLTKLSD